MAIIKTTDKDRLDFVAYFLIPFGQEGEGSYL